MMYPSTMIDGQALPYGEETLATRRTKHERAIAGYREPPSEQTLAVLKAVSVASGIPEQKLTSKRRTAPISSARQVYCYLARRHTVYPMAHIGERVRIDHTSVYAAVRRIQRAIRERDERFLDILNGASDILGLGVRYG